MTEAQETAQLSVTFDQAMALISLGGAFTLIEDAIQNLDSMQLDDDEIACLRLMPEDYRMKVTARLLELVESLRESLRELDGRAIELTA